MISLEVMGLWAKFGCECPSSTAIHEMKHAPIDIIEARIAAMRLGHGSLLKFVVSRGWPKSTAWYAMQGKLNGPLSKRIVIDVKEALGC